MMPDTASLTVECEVHFATGRTGHVHMREGPAEPMPVLEPGRVPRLSRLMALAIRFDRLVRQGEVADYADLARLGHVTRARVTQIMNLLLLAPDIQEEILFLPRTHGGFDPIPERRVRAITSVPDWRKQRRMWATMFAQNHGDARAHTQGDAT
jgi:hypothetical protein